LIWGAEHYEEEHSFLVATGYSGPESPEGAIPVSLIKANIPVQYKVDDLYAFTYNYDNPGEVLEAICYQELTRFTAGATIDTEEPSDSSEAGLFGAGRDKAKDVLTANIQAAADKARLGVKIVFLGLQGIHPPAEVASDYQEVVGAVQKSQKAILDAQAKRNEELSKVAGSIKDTDDLYDLAQKYQQAKLQNDPDRTEQLAEQLDEAFAGAGGDIFAKLREAQSYAYDKTTLAEATGLRFESQLKAYRAAESIFKRQQRLRIFEEALADTRKYVVVADPNDKLLFIFNFEEELLPSLYDIVESEENTQK
jgi:regulator of protease activity HflC (stomatin/prohibitin superfamily)